MKRTIYLLLILVLASFTTLKQTITLSGKIINTGDRKITIKGESFEKTIRLKPDGSFLSNLEIEYDGIYTIETAKNSVPIYFSKESKLALNADDKNFNKTLKYAGKGSIENQYLAKKSNITTQISNEELYKLDENNFLIKIKEIKNAISVLYNQTKFTNAYFKEKEIKNITFLEQLHIIYYPKVHGFFASLRDFKISENFPKADKKLDLDSDSDFLFSNEYKQIVLNQFYESICKDSIKSNLTAKDIIPEIKALKSKNIKNLLIEQSIEDVSIGNPQYEKTYNEFLSIATKPNLIENLTQKYNTTNELKPGKPSPKFDYENQKGGKTSLESLKGKYVYIDLWATWCGPCIQEIPFLQKVEEQYKDKNIAFVSISIDAIKDKEKWSKFVIERKLSGIQLLAENEYKSKLMMDYLVQGVPTFILIDPNGKIISARAPRPSNIELIELLNSLQL